MILNILIVIAIIVALPLIAALLVGKKYKVERHVVISKPTQEVFNYVKFVKNQDHYSKWVMTDLNMKKHFSGTDGTTGFIYAWNGNDKAGEGEQEIIAIVPEKSINIEVRFKRPFKGIAQTHMTTEPLSGQTKVTWGMRGETPYPLNLANLFTGKMLNKDLEVSLHNLKSILESK